jgi:beta-lactamase regulating signal transducer with metallopeptidase domain
MINHLWQSTLFALAAALLVAALRKNRAQVRYWIWFTASLKFFVPFSPLMSLGSHVEFQKIAAPPAVTFAMERIAQPFPQSPSLTRSMPTSTNWKPAAMLGLWACGIFAVAMIRFRAWLRIRAAVRSSSPIDIPAPVDIRTSPGLLEPGVFGFLHPVLLLPEGIAERLTAPQLEAVLAHELCHVRRRDNLLAAVHMLVEAAFWFHPLVWWIGARLVEERERACDEAVLTLGSDPRVYAEGILNVCKLYVESPLVCVSGVTGSDIKKRIEAIMTNRIALKLTFVKKLALATAGVAVLALPILVGVMHPPRLLAQRQQIQTKQVQPQQAQSPPLSVTPNSPMARIYTRYGPPDQIDDHSSDPQNPSQIWRYNYLEDFHSNVVFELTPGRAMRINWPPPVTFEGEPGNFDVHFPGVPPPNVIAGLPGGGHASMQIYPARSYRTLSIPMDSPVAGRVDVVGLIQALSDTGAKGKVVANIRDSIQAPAGAWTYTANFTLDPGSYVCGLLVRDASGQTYYETIDFAVK